MNMVREKVVVVVSRVTDVVGPKEFHRMALACREITERLRGRVC